MQIRPGRKMKHLRRLKVRKYRFQTLAIQEFGFGPNHGVLPSARRARVDVEDIAEVCRPTMLDQVSPDEARPTSDKDALSHHFSAVWVPVELVIQHTVVLLSAVGAISPFRGSAS
jgi:hypothetical protein